MRGSQRAQHDAPATMTTTGLPDDATAASCAYRARAWWGDVLLADSVRAVRVDAPGRAPSLWFPWCDVFVSSLRSAGRETHDGIEFERFDADGPVPDRHGEVTWGDRDEASGPRDGDGVGVVRRCVTPPATLPQLRDHAVVDHDRARVELVDRVDGDDARDVTVKRFPNWGDASDLVAVLDRGAVVADRHRPVVEGSQLLGQAIVAAMRAAPGRRVVSAHMVFLRAANANVPVELVLDEVTSGRTFTAYTARVEQGGRVCASGTLLLGVPAADVVQHAERATAGVPGPYDAVPYDMGVTGRDVRVVDAAYTDDPAAPVGPPAIDAWVRFRAVPDDPALHAGLLAQFTGHMSIAAALRPHAGIGQREAHRTISTAINAIAISFHADVRVDQWVLYRHLATVVAGGMAHAECRAHDQSGVLVASFTVDAMIRPLDRSHPDARTAL
jgi:acyl-CoA thioesterase II